MERAPVDCGTKSSISYMCDWISKVEKRENETEKYLKK
jgi:hypothetical protein